MEEKKQAENEMDDDDIIEEFASGFCKAQNQTRMVMCELKVLSDGKKGDCLFGLCLGKMRAYENMSADGADYE